MKLLRRHKDWLMIVIAVLAIPFVFYFVQRPDYGAMRSDRFARIYDRDISITEAQQIARLLLLAQQLGMTEFVQNMAGGAALMDPNQSAIQFIGNLLVLRHEAERLGIRPSGSEVADVVRKLPAFQGDAGFDMNKFTEFVRNRLAPMGLSEEHIEQVVRDEVSMKEIQKLLSASVTVPKTELDENFQRGYDNFYVRVIRLRAADFDKDIKISDDDVQKYFDAHKKELKTDEKRKVEFVRLGLKEEAQQSAKLPGPLSEPPGLSISTDRFIQSLTGAYGVTASPGAEMAAQPPNELKGLTGPERIEALQKLADRATDFTQALLEKGADFNETAEKFQLPVRETGEFTAASPDPQLKSDPQLTAAAFKLTPQEPNSDPIQVADGFYILHLTGATDARPLSLEEAKPKIVDAIKKSRDRELMSTKGAEVVQQLREAMKSGQPLEAAAQKAGVQPENLRPFYLLEGQKMKPEDNESEEKPLEAQKNDPPDLASIKQTVVFMNPGDVSDFSPSGENGFIAILEKREAPAGSDTGEKKADLEKRLLDNKERIVFYEWLHDRQQAAGLEYNKA